MGDNAVNDRSPRGGGRPSPVLPAGLPLVGVLPAGAISHAHFLQVALATTLLHLADGRHLAGCS